MSSRLDMHMLHQYDLASSIYFSMKLYILIGVVVAVLAVGAYQMQKPVAPESDTMNKELMMKKDDESPKSEEVEKNAMVKKSEYPETGEKMMQKTTDVTGMMQKSEVDGEYDVTAGVPVAGMKNVLFFYASWCPTCRAADADITAKQSSIPKGVVIHKVDYDTATDLKKKYGVTYQHTFVQVDEKGEMITKWSGGDLATIVAKLK